jgi:hypothetical protein
MLSISSPRSLLTVSRGLIEGDIPAMLGRFLVSEVLSKEWKIIYVNDYLKYMVNVHKGFIWNLH